MQLHFFSLVVIAESSGVILCEFLLFSKLLFEFFSHGAFFFDDEFDLCAFLGDGGPALVAVVFEFADLVLVHLDLLVGVGEFLGENFQTFLPLEDAFTFLRAFLLGFAVKSFLHSALDLE